jgi:adenosylcobinamide-GDP ribazoletransferase
MIDSGRLMEGIPIPHAADASGKGGQLPFVQSLRRASFSQKVPASLFLKVYWGAFLTAIGFLTRIPVSSSGCTSQSLRAAPLFFPLVGMLIGSFTGGLIWLTGLLWPVWLAVLLALAAELWLTGALHEDGLADFCDGFGGGWNRDMILAILKDSRIGTYGMLGLSFAVAVRIGSLVAVVSQFGSEWWIYWVAALVASASVGRWMMVLAMVLVPPIAQRESLAQDVAGEVSWRCFALSGLGAAAPLMLFAYLMPINALLGCALITAGMVILISMIRRKLGGITGDCFGCIGYVSQVLLLLAAAARVG